jgi:hypothetical protein
MVIRDIEREDIEFISKTLGCLPIAHIDHMRPEKLGGGGGEPSWLCMVWNGHEARSWPAPPYRRKGLGVHCDPSMRPV